MLPHNSDQTNLSADVAPFVPRKEFQNDSGYVEQGPNPLPRYVTTCYPFVQEQQNGRVPIQPVGSQFVPVSYIGDSTSIHPPPVPTPHNPIVVGMVPPNAGYSAPGGDGIPLLFNNVVHQSVPNHMSTANSTPKHRNIEKSSKRVSRKNVATQNESMTANENNFSADVQMVDSCQQTDFPVAIASKSLTERPSPLKKTRNRRHRSSMLVNSDDRESSSDHADADIDSDSGYYSPKHRMVQKRSGGTSTSELTSGFHQNRLTGGNTTPVSRVVYLAPSPALYQVQAPLSQQVMSGMLSPHPTPPPSLLLTPPGTPLLSKYSFFV
uniref:Selenocysteine insertion sequence-binding protein 2-like n=1 Tax=Phallusia mammillata TaxID=59560 RepID=A0A6F9DST2_9ASCI|nr:selenocysteine insertion sequence-binding protein 2-like [Phallusia mammillata]